MNFMTSLAYLKQIIWHFCTNFKQTDINDGLKGTMWFTFKKKYNTVSQNSIAFPTWGWVLCTGGYKSCTPRLQPTTHRHDTGMIHTPWGAAVMVHYSRGSGCWWRWVWCLGKFFTDLSTLTSDVCELHRLPVCALYVWVTATHSRV